jgi:cobalt-zinc-cadmium efflux system membrane fusion protein
MNSALKKNTFYIAVIIILAIVFATLIYSREEIQNEGHGHGHQEHNDSNGSSDHKEYANKHSQSEHDDEKHTLDHEHPDMEDIDGPGDAKEHADESRVEISPAMAKANGIKTAISGPAVIKQRLTLSGRVQLDPNRLSHSRARFPGVVKSVRRDLGDAVKIGEVLAVVQSNESLQNYNITSAISGVIVMRDVQAGENTGEAPLFTIADVSKVWVELDVFNKDLKRVKTGQPVSVETLNGTAVQGKIDWLSPMAAHASQSVQARIILSNRENLFRPGQFIRGRVVTGEHSVPLAVQQSAIQTLRGAQVVFTREGNVYEAHAVKLGRGDGKSVEVLEGLTAGSEYVSANSYLIKADIEKAGAAHHH